MKTAAVVSSVLALVALSIYLGSAHAQPNEARRGTWVAVVNIRDVLKKYSRAQALQAELDEDLKPHKARAKALKDEIDLLATADSSKPEYRKTNAIAIQIKTREWEKVNTAILQVVEEKHTSKMPAVWNDINLAIEAVSKTHGMQVVLGHGDPEAPEVAAFQSIKPNKLRTCDMGCTVATYVHASVDITPVVVATLNKWASDKVKR